MANHLDKILAVPAWPAIKLQLYGKTILSIETRFYCLNCKNRLKIKKVEDIVRWRKCPTCGFVFIDKQYFSVDEFVNDTGLTLENSIT